MFKRIRSESGFTLVELLVVLAILAILIAVVVPNLAGLTGGAKAKAAQAELDIVQTAMDAMIAANEAMTVEEPASAAKLGPSDDVTIWVVSTYDPSTGTETTESTTGELKLRSASHGVYTWDTEGRVTQTQYE